MGCSNIRGVLSVIGGFLIFMARGHHGTFGNLTPYITSYLRNKKIPADLSYSTSTWIYTASLIGSASTMSLGGIVEKKIGSRLTVLLGGCLMSASVMLTYLTIQESFYLVILSNGFVMGAGFGVAYTIPITAGNRWFPGRKGFINGIIISGFGVGVFIMNQIESFYINLNDVVPDLIFGEDRYFGQEEVLERVPSTFLLIGGIYFGLVLLSAILISNPPPREESSYLLESAKSKDTSATSVSWHPRDALRSKTFYQMWIIFFLYGQVVTLITTLYKAYGQTFIEDDKFLALTGGIGYIVFSVGIIFWGHVADKTSVKVVMITSFLITVVFLLTFIATPYGKQPMFLAWVCVLYFAYSGMTGLMPAMTAHIFGIEHIGVIYGLMNTSQTTASITCSLIVTTVLDLVGWFGMFCISAGCSFTGCMLTCIFVRPDM